jgi:hypothetical protein
MELLQGIQNSPLGEKTIIFISQFTSLLDLLRHIYDIEKLSFALSYVLQPGYLTFAEGIKLWRAFEQSVPSEKCL